MTQYKDFYGSAVLMEERDEKAQKRLESEGSGAYLNCVNEN